jgi:hypothetical protein
MSSRYRNLPALAALLFGVALALAGCSGDSGDPATPVSVGVGMFASAEGLPPSLFNDIVIVGGPSYTARRRPTFIESYVAIRLGQA